jgi:hypothetical protein
VQPPQSGGAGAQLGLLGPLERPKRPVCLPAAVLEQRVEADGRRLHVELQRLACADAGHQLPEGVAYLGPLRVRHHQRVLGRDAQVAHQRPFACDQHAGAVERLHVQQLPGLGQPSGAAPAG